jgi:NAD(P)-dependent dehydrogenase (short-subunit alcohol dehydrogenase family)
VDLGLNGKAAYVTGGARGIGESTIDLFLAEGVTHVVTSDFDAAQLQSNAERWGSRVTTLVADLSGTEATDAAHQAIEILGGPPDILVNNVGSTHAVPFASLTDEDWDASLSLNFMSHVRTSRALVPLMAERGNASAVVFVASDLAKQPETMPVDYAAAKAAILNLTQVLSLTYAPAVRVNAVCPGPIWTNLWTRAGGVADGLSEAFGLPRELAVQKFVDDRHLPLGIGKPEDVANLVAFLCSPCAAFITAAAVSVDGGGTRSIL